jgi:hypothetical protein
MIVAACTEVCPGHARLAENKMGGLHLPFERTGPKRVIYYAQKQSS